MTIDEAIETLTYWRGDFIDLGREEGSEALRLGIEALKEKREREKGGPK